MVDRFPSSEIEYNKDQTFNFILEKQKNTQQQFEKNIKNKQNKMNQNGIINDHIIISISDMTESQKSQEKMDNFSIKKNTIIRNNNNIKFNQIQQEFCNFPNISQNNLNVTQLKKLQQEYCNSPKISQKKLNFTQLKKLQLELCDSTNISQEDLKVSQLKKLQQEFDDSSNSQKDFQIKNNQKTKFIEDIIKQKKYCLICLENIDQDTEVCGKKNEYCQVCIDSYIKSKLNYKDILKIPCLVDTCQHNWTEQQIKLLTNEVLFNRYIRLKKVIKLNKTPGIIFCVNNNCQGYQINYQNKQMVYCQQCYTKICTHCKQEWHNNISCNIMLQIFEIDNNISNKIQYCPSSLCKAIVQKINDCNDITCQNCEIEFCWICKERMTDYHYESYNIFSSCRGKLYSDINIEEIKKIEKQQRYKRIAFYLPELISKILIILLIIVLSFLYWLSLSLAFPGYIIEQYYNCSNVNLLCKFFVRIGQAIIGIILLPLSLLIAPVAVLCYFINNEES